MCERSWDDEKEVDALSQQALLAGNYLVAMAAMVVSKGLLPERGVARPPASSAQHVGNGLKFGEYVKCIGNR